MYFGAKEKNTVTLPHSAQRKYTFLGKIKEMSKTKKLPSRKKIALEWLHQRLGHRYTRSLLDGDNANVWEDIYLIIDTDPFCISCQISSMKKKDRSKNRLIGAIHGTGLMTEEYTPKNWRSQTAQNMIKVMIVF